MNFIFKKEILFYGKKGLKILLVLLVLVVALIALFLIKYKPAYKVLIDGDEIGYIEDINKFESDFDKKMSAVSYAAFYTIEKEPEYQFVYINKNIDTNEDVVYDKIAENTEITYLAYAITIDGEEEVYVDNVEEAEKIVSELSKKYKDNEADLDINITVQEVYTQDIEDYTIEVADSAKKEMDTMLNEKVEEEYENQKHTVNGILIAQKPVTKTTITSRYGARWGTTHKGMDLAAPTGTDIHAAADGVVTKVVNSNVGYGNLVVISHGNGVETYYAHCSKLYATKGKKVKAGDVIAAVGSTGDSTGPHCHFEIRINGTAVNPQGYIYND